MPNDYETNGPTNYDERARVTRRKLRKLTDAAHQCYNGSNTAIPLLNAVVDWCNETGKGIDAKHIAELILRLSQQGN